MAQQAQNDHYDDEESLALAYAAAVNDEARDLKAAGADVVQIDEPYLQARPEQARAYGLKAIDRALEGIDGDTALHICFGYGHIVRDKPAGYSFLEELNESAVRQISLETAQPRLDLSILSRLPDKDDHPRRPRPLRRRAGRDARVGGRPDSRRAPARPGGETRDRTRLRDEVPAPSRRLLQAGGDGGGHRDRQEGAGDGSLSRLADSASTLAITRAASSPAGDAN